MQTKRLPTLTSPANLSSRCPTGSTPPTSIRDPPFYSLNSAPDLVSIRPELATAQDPYVVVLQMNYQAGKRDHALAAWKNVVSSAKNETGVLLCGAYTDLAERTRLFTIDAWESEEYWLQTHTLSEGYVESERLVNAVGNITELSFLKMAGGFLYKAE
ncbi:hypothetical protein ONS95_003004 [Cadophora gregata]|uniref:uncharacterized protein n=1 Tax=Cadophora gregata TaxID=51156 RepID=UPI0026DC77B1|nr:uncharacterized protein ONS95_003004 [Cadophora gregata]KAK0108182.1 hypothetical protein ONS95_003004 [Cadophora gregata]KAK0109224.1 hypothetical protein ONS96_003047 [Cadophora gregata f. sp. sojae]